MDLCTKDGGTGHDAKTAIDADNIMNSYLKDEKCKFSRFRLIKH